MRPTTRVALFAFVVVCWTAFVVPGATSAAVQSGGDNTARSHVQDTTASLNEMGFNATTNGEKPSMWMKIKTGVIGGLVMLFLFGVWRGSRSAGPNAPPTVTFGWPLLVGRFTNVARFTGDPVRLPMDGRGGMGGEERERERAGGVKGCMGSGGAGGYGLLCGV